jgi:TonB family protein
LRTFFKFGSRKNLSSDGAAGGGASGGSKEPGELHLLVAWSDPFAVFASNVADYFLGFLRREELPTPGSTPEPDYAFWRDVDLRTPWPRRGMIDSACAHAALLGLLYAVSIWPAAHLASPETSAMRSGTHYAYPVGAYLPELRGETARQVAARHATAQRANPKPDPELARQEIVSLPQAPDNLHQTIVAPPKIKLRQDVSLPNLVAYQPAPPIQPLAASERSAAKLRLPDLRPGVTGPVADTSGLHSNSRIPALNARVVEPAPEAPDLAQLNARITLPALQAKVAGPAPDLDSLGSGRNVARTNVAQSKDAQTNAQGQSRQIIALNLHPADVRGPVEMPSGNRSGSFAASPGGKPGASGAPGADSLASEGGSALPPNAPAGINVAAPVAPTASTPNAGLNSPFGDGGRAGTLTANPAATSTATSSAPPTAMSAPLASIPTHSIPPPIATAQPMARETMGPRTDLENRIFAGRRSYTLLVNMPNLNTATGSWIIHFVEHKPGSGEAAVSAPQVVSKSDPAYPGELIHDGVQGTVILTATIRADGSVGDIAIAKSLNPRLDRNAAEALSRWLFRPALRDGQAIDLEAVISVPFRAKAGGF